MASHKEEPSGAKHEASASDAAAKSWIHCGTLQAESTFLIHDCDALGNAVAKSKLARTPVSSLLGVSLALASRVKVLMDGRRPLAKPLLLGGGNHLARPTSKANGAVRHSAFASVL